MGKSFPPASDRSDQLAPSRNEEPDDNPLRDYGFAILSLLIAVTLVTILFPAFAPEGESVSVLNPTWLLSLFLGCWLALWICLQALWTWSDTRLNIV